MSKFEQSVISQRFLEVVDELLDKRIIDSVSSFCNRVEYHPQSMSQIRAGKRDVTIELLSKLFIEFGGNPVYILSGKGDKLLSDETISLIKEPPSNYEKSGHQKSLIETLERLVQSKDGNINDLRSTVARLEKYIALLESQLKTIK